MHKLISKLLASSLFVAIVALGVSKTFAANTLITIPPDPSTWLTTNWNAYVHLPSDYNQNPNTYYPAIIFFPGLGEVGGSTKAASLTKKYGPNAYIDGGWNGEVTVDGQVTKFIVISVQPWDPYPTNMVDFKARITYLMTHYRIDPNRVNMTGLSHGAWMANMYAVFKPSASDYSMMDLVASVVNVEGAIPSDNTNQAWWVPSINATPAFPQRFTEFSQRGGKMLGFEQVNDGGRGIDTIANAMNAVSAGSGTYIKTNFGNGGHCCWDNFYGGSSGTAPSTFVINGVSQNIYQWMARQSRTGGGTTNPPPANLPPTANAGSDQTITLPTSSVSLTGSGTDIDGTVTSYAWSLQSKPSSATTTFTNPSAASTTVSGLTVAGTYVFKLTVTDNIGATATDTVSVGVSGINVPPTANAGPDQTIFIPVTTATISGSATDSDGTIIEKSWYQTAGPAAVITSPTSLTTTVTGLAAGVYTFQLKVTDNNYAQGTDSVTITVTSSTLVSVPGNSGNWNAWVKVPDEYNLPVNANKKYPVIIFFPGITENGTNAEFLRSYGPTAYAQAGWDGTATVDGQVTKFIVVSMQPSANWPAVADIKSHIQYILTNYRVDPARVNLTGVSHGGWVVNSVATYKPSSNDYSYVDLAASVVDVAGVAPGSPYPSRFTEFAQRGGKELGIEQVNDPRDIQTIITTMNNAVSGSAVYLGTTFGNGTHCCWEYIYGDATHQPAVFTINGISQTIYQWMARQSRTSASTNPPANVAPTVSAGADKSITLPTNTTTLTGSASDTDGSIASYSWTKVSTGGTSTIVSPTAASTSITGLTQGSYTFRLTVTDNQGAIASDDVIVTVNGAANLPPTANAGSDQTITLPTSSVSLTGSGTDIDGTVTSYAWSLQSKPSSATTTFTNPSAASTTVSGLTVAGTYVFKLTVTDNIGATATDTVSVGVNAAVVDVCPNITGVQETIPVGYIIDVSGSCVPNGGSTPAQTVRVDFGNTDTTTTAAGWNNATNPSLNSSLALINTTGASASITLKVSDAFYYNSSFPNASGNSSGTTSSTLYPAAASRDSWYVSPWSSPADSFGKVTFSGLNTAATYTVKIYASRMGNGDGVNRTGIYTVGSTSQELNATDNMNGTLTFSSIATADGTLSVSVAPKPGVSNYGYLGVIELIQNGGGASTNPPANVAPTVSAGADKSITLPTNTTTLTGSASDTDGSIASYSWTKVSTGGTSTIVSPTAASTSITGLTQGSYTFRLTVTDNQGAIASDDVIVTVNGAAAVNLSAGKAVTTSSTENASLVGANAVDRSTTTRWSSAFSDPQWLYVDLGAISSISRVNINWETAYGKDYLIQVSTNATNWTTIKTVTGNTSTTTDYTGLSGTGRYVRIYGTARATQWGYSIWELEVYGTQ